MQHCGRAAEQAVWDTGHRFWMRGGSGGLVKVCLPVTERKRMPGGPCPPLLAAARLDASPTAHPLPVPCVQTHAVLIERYDAAADSWQHVELPSNANPRRSFLAACGLE